MTKETEAQLYSLVARHQLPPSAPCVFSFDEVLSIARKAYRMGSLEEITEEGDAPLLEPESINQTLIDRARRIAVRCTGFPAFNIAREAIRDGYRVGREQCFQEAVAKERAARDVAEARAAAQQEVELPGEEDELGKSLGEIATEIARKNYQAGAYHVALLAAEHGYRLGMDDFGGEVVAARRAARAAQRRQERVSAAMKRALRVSQT